MFQDFIDSTKTLICHHTKITESNMEHQIFQLMEYRQAIQQRQLLLPFKEVRELEQVGK